MSRPPDRPARRRRPDPGSDRARRAGFALVLAAAMRISGGGINPRFFIGGPAFVGADADLRRAAVLRAARDGRPLIADPYLPFHVRCDGCGARGPMALGVLDVAATCGMAGWRIRGDRHYCPACVADAEIRAAP